MHRAVDLQRPWLGEAEIEAFLRCLPRLPRLRSLRWFACGAVNSIALFQEGVSAVAATLQHFRLDLVPAVNASPGHVSPALLWLTLTRLLPNLVSLEMKSFVEVSGLDFAYLPLMPHLQRFKVTTALRIGSCNPEQAHVIAQCKALTDLHCGQWMPSVGSSDIDQPTQLQSLFASLVRDRIHNGAAPLRRLWLGDKPIIDSLAWQVLSQCTELEEISAGWRTLTEADWNRLQRFQHLQSLTIDGLFPGARRRASRRT